MCAPGLRVHGDQGRRMGQVLQRVLQEEGRRDRAPLRVPPPRVQVITDGRRERRRARPLYYGQPMLCVRLASAAIMVAFCSAVYFLSLLILSISFTASLQLFFGLPDVILATSLASPGSKAVRTALVSAATCATGRTVSDTVAVLLFADPSFAW